MLQSDTLTHRWTDTWKKSELLGTDSLNSINFLELDISKCFTMNQVSKCFTLECIYYFAQLTAYDTSIIQDKNIICWRIIIIIIPGYTPTDSVHNNENKDWHSVPSYIFFCIHLFLRGNRNIGNKTH